jgi:hypothetical protein
LNTRLPGSPEDFEAWLRRLAPAPPEDLEAERDCLWRALHARQPRRGFPRLRLLGLTVVLVLLATNPIEVGSDAYQPIVEQHPRAGMLYRTRFTNTAVTGLERYPTAETRAKAFDAIVETGMTRSARLGGVTGYNIGGRTSLCVIYYPEREGVVYRTGYEAVFPAGDDQPELLDFLQKHAGAFQEGIARGTAHDAGIVSAFVDGRPIALRRWTLTFPDFGIVTHIGDAKLP